VINRSTLNSTSFAFSILFLIHYLLFIIWRCLLLFENILKLLTPWNMVLKKLVASKLVRNSAYLLISKVHYPVLKIAPHVPIVSQMNTGHVLSSYFLKIRLNIIFAYRPRYS